MTAEATGETPKVVRSQQQDWVDLIETGIFLVSGISGTKMRRVPVPGIQTRSLPFSHPLANIVGAAKLEAGRADRSIHQVIEYFRGEGQAFSWRVGPGSSPGDLGARLTAAGLSLGWKMRGMVMEDIVIHNMPRTDLLIRRAGPSDVESLAKLMAASYPAPETFTRMLSEAYMQETAAGFIRVHLAFQQPDPDPIGLGVTYDVPGRPVMILAGGAVLPGIRHSGVYASLLARRLSEAKGRGIRSVAVQAVAGSSAPICRKYGFRDLFEIDVYTWYPDDVEEIS
jgi:hypothetical protein